MRALLVLTALTFIISCKQAKKSGEIVDTPMQTEVDTEDLAIRGEKLLSTYCYQCHDPKMSIDNNLAPPMIAIKNHYIMEETTKEAFVADLFECMS